MLVQLQSETLGGALPRMRLHNRVVPVLFAAGAAAALLRGFVTIAPNRLVSGRPVGLFAAVDFPLAAAVAVLFCGHPAVGAMPPRRSLHRLSALLAGALLLLLPAAAGEAAATLAIGAPKLA